MCIAKTTPIKIIVSPYMCGLMGVSVGLLDSSMQLLRVTCSIFELHYRETLKCNEYGFISPQDFKTREKKEE